MNISQKSWGMLAVLAAAVVALPFPALRSHSVAVAQASQSGDRPQYTDDKQLFRPDNYREWVFLSSGLGMEYNPAVGERDNFTNVFVPAWAYKQFLASGKWPDKTMLALEVRSAGSRESINQAGHFQTDIAGFSVEVKDSALSRDTNQYFIFGKDAKTAKAVVAGNDCWACHSKNGAADNTFVQFYPTLKPVAQKFGTYHATEETK
jgi:cytochrome P460